MRMLTLILILGLSMPAFAMLGPGDSAPQMEREAQLNAMANMSVADFEQMTGQKLNLLEKVAFKKIQRSLKKNQGSRNDIPLVLYIILAVFGLAWIAMGVMDNWKGSTWVVNLVLTLLFWLPGFIHSLIMISRYY
jgi:uncharacterized membrane protein YqaE (UPF0057 family)